MYNKLIQSCENPEKLSRMITGLIPLIILVAAFKGVAISEVELNTIVEAIVIFLGYIGMAVSAGFAFYGAVRKVVVKFQ